jgi:hypothetical protein
MTFLTKQGGGWVRGGCGVSLRLCMCSGLVKAIEADRSAKLVFDMSGEEGLQSAARAQSEVAGGKDWHSI